MAASYLCWKLLKQRVNIFLAFCLIITQGLKTLGHLSIESTKDNPDLILIYLERAAPCRYNLSGIRII